MTLLAFPNSVLVSGVHCRLVQGVMECVITAASLRRAQRGPTHLMRADAPARAPGGSEEEDGRSSLCQGDPGDTHTLIQTHAYTPHRSLCLFFSPGIYLPLQ